VHFREFASVPLFFGRPIYKAAMPGHETDDLSMGMNSDAPSVLPGDLRFGQSTSLKFFEIHGLFYLKVY